VHHLKKEVVDYMIAEYKAGNTPNPDVMCNRYVKFGGFYDWAMKNGADFVATGHYARIVERLRINDSSKKKNPNEQQPATYNLMAGIDENKDQSYFLWTLTQKQLAHTLFPVGHLEKPDVRKLAKKFGLATAEKKDSQGLCFLGKIDVKEFLKQFIKEKKGKVVNDKGEVIGEHNGAFFFTLGERHGFDIMEKTSTDKPYYIIEKNVKKNILIVSNNPIGITGKTGERKLFNMTNTNWINMPQVGKTYSARIRYRQPLQKVKFTKVGEDFLVEFNDEQDGGDSGQSIVFYDGEICIGGGIIK
jgi:tRNA-specific 2-thiouridylase